MIGRRITMVKNHRQRPAIHNAVDLKVIGACGSGFSSDLSPLGVFAWLK
jgi:hypothetical protein